MAALYHVVVIELSAYYTYFSIYDNQTYIS